jgi:hypothetical protein
MGGWLQFGRGEMGWERRRRRKKEEGETEKESVGRGGVYNGFY